MKSRVTSWLAAALLLAACASPDPAYVAPAPGLKRFDMYQGQMYSMTDGTEFRFEIGGPYAWSDEVFVRARNPATSEVFSGRLMLLEKGSASTAVITNAWGAKTGEIQTTTVPDARVARGVMKGDKGTLLNLVLDTKCIYESRPGGGAPFFYRGVGEAVDGQGNKFAIQFNGSFRLYWHKSEGELLQAAGREL